MVEVFLVLQHLINNNLPHKVPLISLVPHKLNQYSKHSLGLPILVSHNNNPRHNRCNSNLVVLMLLVPSHHQYLQVFISLNV
jgi:hypothetical protein